MQPFRRLLLLFFLLPRPEVTAGDLHLNFIHVFNDQPLVPDSLRYRNQANEWLSITRLSYLLSHFQLQTEDGTWVNLPDQYAWIDLSSDQTRCQLKGLPDEVTYTAIRFDLGLPPAVNHSDPAQYPSHHALNPNQNKLHWTWQSGYIFLALEGRFMDQTNRSGFVYHLANDWNRTGITLPLLLDLHTDAALEIQVDLAAIFDSNVTIGLQADGTSTHSAKADPLAQKLQTNLPSAFSLLRAIALRRQATPSDPEPIDLPSVITPFPLKFGKQFPLPSLPSDNPLIFERVDLGKQLFFDSILSRDNTISCASCHHPDQSFSDNRRQSIGINGAQTRRHSMPLINLAWKEHFFWDGRVSSLREQVLHPIENPQEMGSSLESLLAKLKRDSTYPSAFARAFKSGHISALNLGLALEAYLLTLVTHDAPFDLAMKGKGTLTPEEQRGFQLFFTEFDPRSGKFGADCFHCHGGALFSDNQFHDNGLKPTDDLGRFEVTSAPKDQFTFATPTLRNLTQTAPYMHDGRFQSLEEVVAHYNGPIDHRETLDPNLAKHPRSGLNLSAEDQAALVAYLKTLSSVESQPPTHSP